MQCKSWDCGQLRTLQITEHLAPYLDLLNLLTWFHAEITPIGYLQCDYESFPSWSEEVTSISKLSVITWYFSMVWFEKSLLIDGVLHGIYWFLICWWLNTISMISNESSKSLLLSTVQPSFFKVFARVFSTNLCPALQWLFCQLVFSLQIVKR